MSREVLLEIHKRHGGFRIESADADTEDVVAVTVDSDGSENDYVVIRGDEAVVVRELIGEIDRLRAKLHSWEQVVIAAKDFGEDGNNYKNLHRALERLDRGGDDD